MGRTTMYIIYCILTDRIGSNGEKKKKRSKKKNYLGSASILFFSNTCDVRSTLHARTRQEKKYTKASN